MRLRRITIGAAGRTWVSGTRHRRTLAFQGVLLLGVWALFAFSMIEARDQARDAAITSLANLSTALALDTSHDIELLDQSMEAAALGWSNDEIRALKPSLRNAVVFDSALTTSHFGAVLILDPYGALQASSDTSHEAPRDGYADRPEFKAQLDGSADGLFVGPPFVDPMNGEWSLPLSRRLVAPDGSFAGAVMGTLRLSTLHSSYERIHLGPDSVIALARDDGLLIDREPAPPSGIQGTPIRISASHGDLSATDGWYRARSSVDGRDRIYGFHRVGTLPLIQFAAMPAAQVYAGWWRRTASMAAVLALLSFGVLLLQHRLRRELQSREAAERKLQDLASLDPLTRIANRRTFDAATEREWLAGAARGRPIGLLMVDVDYFKPFNDRYGHLAGDRALARIAGALAAAAERHGGLACRYGGEEFAVLLPVIEQQSIRVVAQDVITAVDGLALASAVAPRGRITVSVGAAALVPRPDSGVEELIAAADQQLYVAKSRGRGRVAQAGIGEDERAAA